MDEDEYQRELPKRHKEWKKKYDPNEEVEIYREKYQDQEEIEEEEYSPDLEVYSDEG